MPFHPVAVSTNVDEDAGVAVGKGVEKIVVLIHMAWAQEAIHPRMAKMHPGIRGRHRQATCLEMLKALVADVMQRDIGCVHVILRSIWRISIKLYLRTGK
ncbi:hypothetical protein L3X38_012820 [Prunus dulcis]|uniref:Uncharacterized protein n=1 Tax=Prunus dulcis TaxID=3755 RepID=A0AAD4WK13_PRUDU|nr:hypothetical protein L3X38_012820 [Prunus dulcis]